jgi:hypothetical protein
MQEAARQQGETGEEFATPEFASEAETTEEARKESAPAAPALDVDTRKRIEQMFKAAQKDRAKAFRLKQELDRLNVFKEYEDRFLDLFKKAE